MTDLSPAQIIDADHGVGELPPLLDPAEFPPDEYPLAAASQNGAEATEAAPQAAPHIVTAQQFAAVAEPGADPLVGEPGQAVIPEGGDVMLYGDGGASKTTLSLDLAAHLAAGDDWLGLLPTPAPVRVLVIEAEGPRPLFRDKVRRKLAGWHGSDLADRLLVLERPWASFRFPEGGEIADLVGRSEVDVLIVGPLTRIGMEELGTLQQVRDFMAQIACFRARTGRRLAVVVVHHENKGGKVSGAWEGAGDTLMHAQVFAQGKTILHFQKARWSSAWHKRTLELDWTEGEGFEAGAEPKRDLLAEISAWLLANPHSTPREIATGRKIEREDGTKETIAGLGVRQGDVEDVLHANHDRFMQRSGEAARQVGRRANAHAWEVKADVA